MSGANDGIFILLVGYVNGRGFCFVVWRGMVYYYINSSGCPFVVGVDLAIRVQ